MRRLTLAAFATILLSACIPEVRDSTAGFKFARHADKAIRVADIPNTQDFADRAVTRGWNEAAGRQVFRLNAVKPPHVTFKVKSPIVAPDGSRRAAWVQVIRGEDGWYTHCTVHYDPALSSQLNAGTWAHELGHCLGFADVTSCSNPYRGVMSYCGFWSDRSKWFGADDRKMLVNAGYG